jgi:mRNA interferase HicA
MKYSEFHRKILKNGWKYLKAEGSHYFYEKDGKESPPIPFHGAKEMGEGLRKKIIKEMGLVK